MNAHARTIAVVDDDAAVCESMRFLLEADDLNARMYLRGAEFLRDSPDVACLIVDYLMPGLNGLDLISELRQRGSGVPAIMITAGSTRVIEQRAAELGIQQILQKPLLGQALLCAIREVLG